MIGVWFVGVWLVFVFGEVEAAVELVESMDLAVDIGGVLADVVE